MDEAIRRREFISPFLKPIRTARSIFRPRLRHCARLQPHDSPAINRRDKVTQVKWGIMILRAGSTAAGRNVASGNGAVDTETLQVLAEKTEFSSRFLLRGRPSACARRIVRSAVRRERCANRSLAGLPGATSVEEAHQCLYDGTTRRAWHSSGFAERRQTVRRSPDERFSDTRQGAQLVHIATDGESYGHHHHYGEMAPSFVGRNLERR